MSKVKAILFDIDDTLYDSTTLTTMARRNSISAMIDAGLPDKDEERIFHLLQDIIQRFGSNFSRHYDELLKTLGIEWSPKIIAAGVVAYERTKAGFLKPIPEVVPVLMDLKQDFRLGIISNGLAIKQWEKLTWLGLHHFFDSVTTSEEVGAEKPNFRIFNDAVLSLGVKPKECVMVGDRVDTDIKGASMAGMISVRIRKGKYGGIKPRNKDEEPAYEISEIGELLDIIERITNDR